MSTLQANGDFTLDQLLVKRFLTPGGSIAPSLAPELFGVVTLENDRAEWGYLKGEMRMGTQVSGLASVGGQRTRMRLANPVNSRLIAVITRIQTVSTAAHVLRRMQSPPPNLTTILATTPLDTRRPLTAQASSLIVSGGAEVGSPPGSQAFCYSAANVVLDWREPIVLAPGGAFDIECIVDATALGPTWVTWYERGANPSELL